MLIPVENQVLGAIGVIQLITKYTFSFLSVALHIYHAPGRPDIIHKMYAGVSVRVDSFDQPSRYTS